MRPPVLRRYDFGARVTAFSTTRHGGCSIGNYAAFNINAFCGDAPDHLLENRRRLAAVLGLPLASIVVPHQTHGVAVLPADEPFAALDAAARDAQLEGVDALTTHVPGLCIGVSTADCIPLLLYDAVRHAAAAVHAGWRGTQQRIVQHAVRAMQQRYGTRPENLQAVIGPGIRLESFEVGDEVWDAFARASFDMAAIARRFPAMAAAGRARQEKWHIDLPLCNRLQLEEAGVRAIHDTGICTYRQHADYFSARRLGIRSGRIYTAIILK